MAWNKLGTTTLGSAGDDLDITSMTANKFNQFMVHTPIDNASNNINHRYTFDDNSATDYAYRESIDGATDGTFTSQSLIGLNTGNHDDLFDILYVLNIDSEEKLLIGFQVSQGSSGAGTAPSRSETVGKYDTTTNTGQFTRIDCNNSSTGNYNTDSNLSAIGSDITPAAAITFPTNVQAGSRAEITDSRKMYNYVVPSITFQDDFSSDNWTDSDSTNIGVSGGALNWSMFRDMSNDASSRDLGSVASDKWVLRFKVTQGSSIGSTQAGNGFHFGISDSNNSVAQNASQDFVGMSYYYDNQSSYRAQDSDGAAVPEVWGGDSSQNFTITANDVFYFEIIKNGSSYTVEGFTNSDYSTGSLGQISGTTTATGLRYLKIMNDLPAQGAVPTSTNPFNGTIDDVKFYDGFTQTTSFWQEIGT
jgi:hypothetical protein